MSSVPQSDCTPRDSRGRLMQQLLLQLGRWEAAAAEDATVFSSGAAAIDRLLPGGGLRHGMLVEWLSAQGGGAATLSLLAAREACREGGALVVIDRRQIFYPQAAAAWGIDLDRLIVVRPRSARDELWAAVQSLRSPAVAAVWGMIDRLDSPAFRRVQLAAQAGRTLGLLLRPPSARGQPSWADVRLGVSPLSVVRSPLRSYHGLRTMDHGRYQHVRLLRCRSGRPDGSATLEIDDTAYAVRDVSSNHDTHPLPMVAELADPADRSFPARA
ncbi:MAG TPA: hypothetical protein VGK58_19780 [Lacipirellulaceae bacterium]